MLPRVSILCFFFFFNDTATTEIYTLSLHDALPISSEEDTGLTDLARGAVRLSVEDPDRRTARSEEHTSELQSRPHLVCRLLLEKKKASTCTRRAAHPTTFTSYRP